jgi:hypothetical protein
LPVAGGGPVVVDILHTTLGSDESTRAVTLVRQGDDVIAMIIAQDNVRKTDEVAASDLWKSLEERPAF